MPELTVPTTGVDLEPGFYPATLLRVEQREGENPSKFTGLVEPYLRWYLEPTDVEYVGDLWATTSCKLGARSTAGRWIRGLGFDLTPGTTFNTDDLEDLSVMFQVEADEDGNPKITNIGPARKRTAKANGAAKRPRPVADEEDDDFS